MSSRGIVKSFNNEKGWGFIECSEVDGDVFLHVKDCTDGRPNAGDEVDFDLQDDAKRGGQKMAVNVTGCTGEGNSEGKGKGKGKGNGRRKEKVDDGRTRAAVKSFNDAKGWGFIDHNGVDVFLHVKDCLDGRPMAGDLVTFDLEDDQVRAGQLKASNVSGCSGFAEEKGKGKGGPRVPRQTMVPPMPPMARGYGGPPMAGCYGGPPLFMEAPMAACYGRKGNNSYGMAPMAGSYGMMSYGGGKGQFNGGGYGSMGHTGGGKGQFNGGGYGSMRGGTSGGDRKHGIVKSYNDDKGWGFIDFRGTDVFLHVKDCVDGRPQAGDPVSFETEPDAARGGQLKALDVRGCSGQKGRPGGGGDSFGAAKGSFGRSSGPYGKGKCKGGR